MNEFPHPTGISADTLGLRAPLQLGVPVLILTAALSYHGLHEHGSRQ